MLSLLQIIEFILGFAIISLAVFLKEDEERNLINRVEQLWQKLEVAQTPAIAKHRILLLKAGTLSKQILNNLYGKKIFSHRFLIVSINLSVISYWTFLSVYGFAMNLHESQSNPEIIINPVGFFIISGFILYFIIVWIIMLMQNTRKWFYGFCYFLLAFNLWFIYWYFHTILVNGFSEFIALLISVLTDVILIYILRKQFEKINDTNLFRIFFKICMISLVAFLLFVASPLVFLTGTNYKNHLIEFATDVLWYQSFGDVYSLFPFLIFFCSILLFGIHRVIWPIIIRPIYSLKRFGVFKYRKSLFTLGIILIVSSVNSDPLFVPKTLIKLIVGA
jgi:hypothetical protein